jgi:hypothetical protein
MRLTNRIKQAGATGYILLWLPRDSHSDSAPDLSAARLLLRFGKRLRTALVVAISRPLNRYHPQLRNLICGTSKQWR